MAHIWRFHREWTVAASADDVYAVWADLDAYPSWWREVRSLQRVDESIAKAEIRSVLPYTLHLRMTREVEDPVGRRLRTALAGDLTGWAEVHVEQECQATARVVYRQQVEVTVPVLGRVAPLFGPVLRANHAAMMRSCERGLAKALGLLV